jgi:hypothetical protein
MSLSFKPVLMEKVLAGEKTVTRRTLPTNYAEDQVVSIVPGMGRVACGKVKIVGYREELLNEIHRPGEAESEGFASAKDFAAYWNTLPGPMYDPWMTVARIEFELIDTQRTICKCCAGMGTLAAQSQSGGAS